MKKELFIPIALTCFEILFSSYYFRTNNIQVTTSTQQSDTVVKEIPLDRHGKADLFYRTTKQKANQLGLDSLELGYDSLQIRVWFDYSLARKKHLLIIKRANNIWICQLYTIQTLWNAVTDRETILSKDIRNVKPKIGFENFAKKLLSYKITSLPNEKSSGLDGVTYCIEVATKNQYRFYKYWSPETTENKSWESKNIVKIINLLEKEFDFKRLQK